MAISHVNGTITRVFFEGKGAEVTESFKKRDGSEGSTRWAAFFDQPHGLVEGARVAVSGIHSDKIDEWEKDGETRRTVKRTLNSARLKEGAQAQQAESGQSSQPAVFDAPEAFTGEVPF
jgi:hypothetical protein